MSELKEQAFRFISKIDFSFDCWTWKGCKIKFGHGKYWSKGRVTLAHRHSYEIFNKVTLPPEALVLHKCDVPSCVNPAHLYIGTHRNNTDDKISRGRHNSPKGSRHWKAKLNEQTVARIRKEYTGDRRDISRLAEKYGVGKTTIYSVVKNITWVGVAT